MWFKNLRVYTFAKPLAQSFEEIETAPRRQAIRTLWLYGEGAARLGKPFRARRRNVKPRGRALI